jgi:hypothetical protein
MSEKLQVERRVFDDHVEEWRSSHSGQFVLIKNEDVIDFFGSLEEAFKKGISLYGMNDFFIEQILPANSVNISFIGQVA